jgi:hypothetical protein
MSDLWFPQFCDHKQTSPVDEMGDAICADCGKVIRKVLTEAGFMEAANAVYRDYGHFGHHSKRCVHLEDGGWICASDCRIHQT